MQQKEERRAWFLRDADKLTTAEIRQLFSAEESAEAAGILDMTAPTPEEFLEYTLRLKPERDASARMQKSASVSTFFSNSSSSQCGLPKSLPRGILTNSPYSLINSCSGSENADSDVPLLPLFIVIESTF
jgi:hypothetical protein